MGTIETEGKRRLTKRAVAAWSTANIRTPGLTCLNTYIAGVMPWALPQNLLLIRVRGPKSGIPGCAEMIKLCASTHNTLGAVDALSITFSPL